MLNNYIIIMLHIIEGHIIRVQRQLCPGILDGPLILWVNWPVVDSNMTCTIYQQSEKFVIGLKIKVTTFYSVAHCYLNLLRGTMCMKKCFLSG